VTDGRAEPEAGLGGTDGGDVLLAVRNAFTLGASLLLTWAIAIAMRLVLPRYLGPVRLGTLTFADGFAIAFFAALGLGADSYVRKEVSVRLAHASEFFGGLFAARVVMTVGLFAVMATVMNFARRPAEVRWLVYTFGVAQFFVQNNSTLSALLHTAGKVDGMSVLAVATKIVWAGGILLAIAAHAELWAFAAALLASEAIETVVLFHLTRRHLRLAVRVQIAATTAMIVAGLPYYLHAFAIGAYGKLDVTLLAFLGTDREVGWYAAASTIAGLTLMAAPLLNWVVMPVFARAASRSRDELDERVRATNEVVLMAAIPVSLLVVLGASDWVRLLFGAAFAPAAAALRILAGTFVLTHVGIVYGSRLIMLGRAWTLTGIGVGGLALNGLLNVLLVRPAMKQLGDGGGGVGCAIALLLTEVVVTGVTVSIAGRRALDRSTVATVVKSSAVALLVVAIDRVGASLGVFRLAADALAYVILAMCVGALRALELTAVVRTAFRARRQSVGYRG
jgi:O-antigen/teichoic acid export membrane protein